MNVKIHNSQKECMFAANSMSIQTVLEKKLIIFNFSLIKEESNRPKYKTLLQHPFIQLHEKLQCREVVAEFVGNKMKYHLKGKQSYQAPLNFS